MTHGSGVSEAKERILCVLALLLGEKTLLVGDLKKCILNLRMQLNE